RAHRRAGDRLARAVEHATFDRATSDERELGHAMPGLELDAARRQVPRCEGVGDPPAVRYALDAKHPVVAGAREARRLIFARGPELDRSDDRRALVAIDDAADDDRARFETQLDRHERSRTEPRDAHRARGEPALIREYLVATFGQVRH